ncbi:MAG: hypothetical protein O7A69_02150, partial [SAR324 cluster bacterium]|nr:hypothetical protein [SAR324 cluster bacterium]
MAALRPDTQERGYYSQNSFNDASHPEQCGLKSLDQRNMITIATMIATIGAAMMKSSKRPLYPGSKHAEPSAF